MRGKLACVLLFASLLLPANPALAGSPEENQKVVLKMAEAINARDLEALDALVAADVHRYSGATPGLVVESLEQFKEFLRADFASVPDSVQTVNLIFGGGDLVAMQATYSGTQTGAFGPFPPSGKRLDLPFIGILRIEDGKVAEIWVEWDNLTALMQLGHFPPPEAAVAAQQP